jgi:Flp pilus assembly protein TadD
VAELQKASALLPDDPALHYVLAQTLQKAGRPAEAANQLQLAQELERRQKDAAVAVGDINRGAALLQNGDDRGAEAAFREAVSLTPRDPLTHYHLGLSLLLQNKLEEAIAEFRTTLELRPDDGDTLYYLGRALMEARQHGEAVACLRHALDINPTDAHARNVLAVALARMQDLPTASTELKHALTLEPDNPRYRQNLSCIEQQMRGCELVP